MRGGLVTPKTPARVIHTSIRVPVTAEAYSSIKRAAKLRGAPSLASWLRERGASHAFADGIEGLATAEDCKDALRRLLETQEAWNAARERVASAIGYEDAIAAAASVVRTRDLYWAARAVAKDVAK